MCIAAVEQAGLGMKVVVGNYKRRFFPAAFRVVEEAINLSLDLPLEEGLQAGVHCLYFPDVLLIPNLSQPTVQFIHAGVGEATPLSQVVQLTLHWKGREEAALLIVPEGANPPDFQPQDWSEYQWLEKNGILPKGVMVLQEPVAVQYPMFDPSSSTYFPQQSYFHPSQSTYNPQYYR